MERLLFIPQPEKTRNPVFIERDFLRMGHQFEMNRPDGSTLTSTILPVAAIQELSRQTDRRTFRIGGADSEQLLREKIAIIEALTTAGVPSSALFTLTESADWAHAVANHNILRIASPGPVENVPGFAHEQSTVQGRSLTGEAITITSTRKAGRISGSRVIAHPDSIIPYTLQLVTASGEAAFVTIPTGATDIGMSSVEDAEGRTHIYINSALRHFAEYTGNSAGFAGFLNELTAALGEDAIHWVEPFVEYYGTPGILEWNGLLLAQNLAPEQAESMEHTTGKRVLVLPQTPAHHEAGYGLPRCLAGSFSRENAALIAQISDSGTNAFTTLGNYGAPVRVLNALSHHFRTFR